MGPLVDTDDMEAEKEEEIPSPSIVARLKAQFPDRTLERVEMIASNGTKFVFVVSAPTRFEWKKYQQEGKAATGDVEKQEHVITIAALAQIRWPEKTEARKIFDAHPGLWSNFPEVLNKLACVDVEVRTKKL